MEKRLLFDPFSNRSTVFGTLCTNPWGYIQVGLVNLLVDFIFAFYGIAGKDQMLKIKRRLLFK